MNSKKFNIKQSYTSISERNPAKDQLEQDKELLEYFNYIFPEYECHLGGPLTMNQAVIHI